MRRPNGSIIGPLNASSTSSAQGIWSIDEHTVKKYFGQWPIYSIDSLFNTNLILIHADGANNSSNNTYIDNSSNNYTITANGTPSQGTRSPFSISSGNWSVYFDGTSVINIDANTLNTIGTSDFTLEMWTNTSTTSSNVLFCSHQIGGMISCGFNANNTINLSLNTSGGSSSGYTSFDSAATFSANTWYHVAWVRIGTNVSLYINGVKDTNSLTLGANTNIGSYGGPKPFYIGAGADLSSYYTGYISNFRFIKGTGIYTTAFNPITSALTVVTNTRYLMCQNSSFRDTAGNATYSLGGTPVVQTFSPFSPIGSYFYQVGGGSSYFSNASDYLSISSNPVAATGQFTIEAWIYTSVSATQIIFSQYLNTDASRWHFSIDNNTGYKLAFQHGTAAGLWGATVVPLNQWNHVAVTRDSANNLRIFLNGVQDATVSGYTYTLYTTSPRISGFNNTPSYQFQGYISNLRINNTALYTSNFAIPTALLTAVSGTQLLANSSNGTIIDQTGKNNIGTVGGAVISTTIGKFSSSISFNGTTSYLTVSSPFVLGLNNFTLECWVYLNGTPSVNYWIYGYRNGNDSSPYLFVNSSRFPVFAGDITTFATSATAIALTTWTHVAVIRNGTLISIYQNGTLTASATTNTSFTYNGINYIGATNNGSYYLNGYIDEFRLSLTARYTTGFTPSTSPFANQ